MVSSLTYDAADSAVYYQHCTGFTGSHPAVEGCIIDADSAFSGLTNGILLRMNRANTVLGDATVLM
jgi:hypothetical protein